MKIAIGCDHRGYSLKPEILQEVTKLGHEIKDFGSFDEKQVDYPDYALTVARAVAKGEFDCGILICGTGIGMSVAANKIKGIRAARCQDCFSAKMARQHNDANILCLGGLVMGAGLAREVVRAYLEAKFEGGHHARRLEKISAVECST